MSIIIKSESQSCLSLCNHMDCSPPGSTVHGILQTKILEWVAFPFSRGSSQPRGWTRVSPHYGQILYCLRHQRCPIVNEDRNKKFSSFSLCYYNKSVLYQFFSVKFWYTLPTHIKSKYFSMFIPTFTHHFESGNSFWR